MGHPQRRADRRWECAPRSCRGPITQRETCTKSRSSLPIPRGGQLGDRQEARRARSTSISGSGRPWSTGPASAGGSSAGACMAARVSVPRSSDGPGSDCSALPIPWSSPAGNRRAGASCTTPAGWSGATGCLRSRRPALAASSAGLSSCSRRTPDLAGSPPAAAAGNGCVTAPFRAAVPSPVIRAEPPRADHRRLPRPVPADHRLVATDAACGRDDPCTT